MDLVQRFHVDAGIIGRSTPLAALCSHELLS